MPPNKEAQLLHVQHLTKSYSITPVLDGIDFVLQDGEHAALIGPNGAGKSTLVRCLTGLDRPDSGSIVLSPPDAVIGYLPQSFVEHGDLSAAAFLAESGADILLAEKAVAEAADALNGAADLTLAMEAYAVALDRFERLGGVDRIDRSKLILDGLGLGDLDLEGPVAILSGGQKTRLGLAALLLREPDLLILDEPTNHLDVDALEWLEGFVREYPRSALIVSHDRAFLNATVTRTLYLDAETHQVTSYPGDYDAFVAARAQEARLRAEAWTRQQEYVAKVEGNIHRLKDEALTLELSTTPRQPGLRKLAWKKAKIALAREKKLDRFLDSPDRVDKPRPEWGLHVDLGEPAPTGQDVFRIRGLSFGFPGQPLLFRDVDLDIRAGERIAIAGPNGAGKSTLLHLLSGRYQPVAGSIRAGSGVAIGLVSQEHETLDLDRTVLDSARLVKPISETDARTFLHYFLFKGEDVLRTAGECSLGERSRLQLALLVLAGCNVLLLDEPLNHLDIDGREHFEEALARYRGTVIAVSHDRSFLRSFPTRIVGIRDGALRTFEGGYEEYLQWK